MQNDLYFSEMNLGGLHLSRIDISTTDIDRLEAEIDKNEKYNKNNASKLTLSDTGLKLINYDSMSSLDLNQEKSFSLSDVINGLKNNYDETKTKRIISMLQSHCNKINDYIKSDIEEIKKKCELYSQKYYIKDEYGIYIKNVLTTILKEEFSICSLFKYFIQLLSIYYSHSVKNIMFKNKMRKDNNYYYMKYILHLFNYIFETIDDMGLFKKFDYYCIHTFKKQKCQPDCILTESILLTPNSLLYKYLGNEWIITGEYLSIGYF